MPERLLICQRCGCEIQRNTPLEHGGTILPVPSLCEGCRENDANDGHVLEVVSLGLCPAGLCGCGHWGWSATHQIGDTEETKRQMLVEAHRQHVEEAK